MLGMLSYPGLIFISMQFPGFFRYCKLPAASTSVGIHYQGGAQFQTALRRDCGGRWSQRADRRRLSGACRNVDARTRTQTYRMRWFRDRGNCTWLSHDTYVCIGDYAAVV